MQTGLPESKSPNKLQRLVPTCVRNTHDIVKVNQFLPKVPGEHRDPSMNARILGSEETHQGQAKSSARVGRQASTSKTCADSMDVGNSGLN